MYESLILILMFLVGFVTDLCAQTSNIGHSWTLDECISYAIENNVEVKNAELDYKSSKADVSMAAASFAPYIQAGFDGNVRWGRNVDQETNQYVTTTKYTNEYSLSATLDLFNGGQIINGWRQARVSRDKSRNQAEQKRDDIAIEIMKAYTSVVYYKGSVSLKESKLATSKELLRQAKLQEELGIKSKNEVALIQATYSADQSSLIAEKKLHENSLMQLKMYMNMPAGQAIDIDTTMTDTQIAFGSDRFEDVYDYASENHLTIKAIKLDKKYYNLSYKTSILSTLPTISVYASVGTGYYKNLTNHEGAHYREQFENNHGEILGMTVKLPLFDRLGKATTIKRTKINYMKIENQEKHVMQQLEQNVQLAIMDRDAMVVEVASLESNVEATELAYDLASKKFKEGLLSALEVRSSAEELYNSKLNLLRKRLTLMNQQRLVDYYKGIKSWN